MTDDEVRRTVDQQVARLRALVSEQVDIETGTPRPGATKEKMLAAIKACKKVTRTYDEMTARRAALNKDIAEGLQVKAEVQDLTRRMMSRGACFPEWYMRVMGLDHPTR